MKFKKGCLPTDYKERIAYLYKYQEFLRVYHNVKGKAFRDSKITEKEFRDFQKNWFEPRNLLCSKKICECREKFAKSSTIIVSFTHIEED